MESKTENSLAPAFNTGVASLKVLGTAFSTVAAAILTAEAQANRRF